MLSLPTIEKEPCEEHACFMLYKESEGRREQILHI